MTSGPIGVLDSGVGGLSVLRHIRALLPHEDLIYVADQAHVPYGPRPQEEIQAFTLGIANYLVDRGAKLIVVACNAASAAALDTLRECVSEVPIVGMEPAVKPAAGRTLSGTVGVLATPGTLNSHRYASLMARFAAGITVLEDPCAGLVELIEAGALSDPSTEQLLRGVVEPMLAAGADTLVLGCTHYPFVTPLLERIAGDSVAIIDPGPAVARQSLVVLQQNGLQILADRSPGKTSCLTSGDPARLASAAKKLLGYACETHAVYWRDGELRDA